MIVFCTELFVGFAIDTRHSGKTRSFFFFVLILLLRELRTPEMLSRLQALSPDLLLRGALASNDPSDSELGLRLVVLNYNLISNLHFASITTSLPLRAYFLDQRTDHHHLATQRVSSRRWSR
jgi:hypothetical protein